MKRQKETRGRRRRRARDVVCDRHSNSLAPSPPARHSNRRAIADGGWSSSKLVESVVLERVLSQLGPSGLLPRASCGPQSTVSITPRERDAAPRPGRLRTPSLSLSLSIHDGAICGFPLLPHPLRQRAWIVGLLLLCFSVHEYTCQVGVRCGGEWCPRKSELACPRVASSPPPPDPVDPHHTFGNVVGGHFGRTHSKPHKTPRREAY